MYSTVFTFMMEIIVNNYTYIYIHTQALNSCTSRLDVCHCLTLQTPMDYMPTNWSSTLVVSESKLLSVLSSSYIHDKETGWQLGVRLCLCLGRTGIKFWQELNVGTVSISILALNSLH